MDPLTRSVVTIDGGTERVHVQFINLSLCLSPSPCKIVLDSVKTGICSWVRTGPVVYHSFFPEWDLFSNIGPPSFSVVKQDTHLKGEVKEITCGGVWCYPTHTSEKLSLDFLQVTVQFFVPFPPLSCTGLSSNLFPPPVSSNGRSEETCRFCPP